MSSSYEEMLEKSQALNSRAHLELDTLQNSEVLRYLYFLSGKNIDNHLNSLTVMLLETQEIILIFQLIADYTAKALILKNNAALY